MKKEYIYVTAWLSVAEQVNAFLLDTVDKFTVNKIKGYYVFRIVATEKEVATIQDFVNGIAEYTDISVF